jgi:DNA-binding winged helix-turn-helix (wHTH) protein
MLERGGAMETMASRYQFGTFVFDPTQARLLRGGAEVPLQPKLHEALHYFLQRAGQLVTRDELLEALWPGLDVNEEVLTQLVKKLRRALDDDAKEPRYLVTVLKRGYRFQAQPLADEGPQNLALQPPRAAYDPRWYVARPEEEKRARDYLATPGLPAVLLAPERSGKTWLLRHLLHEARREPGTRAVALSLDLFDREALGSLATFLRELSLQLCAALGVPDDEVARAFARSPNPKANMNWLLERALLPDQGRLVIALDRADALWGLPVQDEFFGLLRAWAENGAAEEKWPALRLLLAVSTTPALLIRDPSQSPFNLTEPIRLLDLDEAQVLKLAALHRLALGPAEAKKIAALVGGHPYLVRLALYALAQGGRALDALLAPGGVYDDYLARLSARLLRQPGLREALSLAARGAGREVPPEAAQRLLGAGLLTADGTAGLRLRHALYQRLLPEAP